MKQGRLHFAVGLAITFMWVYCGLLAFAHDCTNEERLVGAGLIALGIRFAARWWRD